MLLFAVAVVVALAGVGLYYLYNPESVAVTLAGHHFAAVPVWVPVALAAAIPLSLFLLHALWTGVRIWLLKRAVRRVPEWEVVQPWPPAPRAVPVDRPARERPARERPAVAAPARQRPAVAPPPPASRRKRASVAPPPPLGPQPAPKRSWLNRD
jgi:hypothetical protein